ncbi:ATP-binding cassette domain-containing protein [Streptomyces sp. NPDC055607]
MSAHLLRELLRPHARGLGRIALWSGVEAAPVLASGFVLARAVDHGFLAGRPGTGLAWLGVMGAALVLRAFATRRLVPVVADVVEPVRDRLVTRVVEGSLARATARAAPGDGADVSRITRQVEQVRAITGAMLRSFRSMGLTAVAAVAGMVGLAPLLGLAMCVPLLLCAVALRCFARGAVRCQRAQVLAEEEVGAASTRALEGLRDVLACGTWEEERERLDEAFSAEAAASRAAARAGARRALLVLSSVHLPLLLLLVAAPGLVGEGRLTAGQVLGLVGYLVTGLEPAVRSLSGIVLSWGVQLAVVSGRLARFAVPPPQAPQAMGRIPAGHALVAEGLTFTHGPSSPPVFEDLDLTLEPGDHLAVVGPSGAGKSTLADLLAGHLPPASGRVTYGGEALADLSPARLRADITLMPQESYVFRGTLRENLAYLAPDADDDALDRSVDALGARGLVSALGGYDAELTDPLTQTSSGQRQLVGLVRVHLSAARVVILDEATSHLSPEAEERAERAMASRPGILIVIAHRLSSARRAGRVLLLNDGGATIGTHAELSAGNDLYADLVGHWRRGDGRDPAGAGASPSS